MPGRRAPRRPIEVMQAEHNRSAFLGGLDGYASVPYPVAPDNIRTKNRAQAPTLYFAQDEFTCAGGTEQFTLSHLPVLNSESVFLCRTRSGEYRREDITWSRDSGSQDIVILNGMNAQAGDVVVVEYAYYTGEPPEVEPPDPWITIKPTGIRWLQNRTPVFVGPDAVTAVTDDSDATYTQMRKYSSFTQYYFPYFILPATTINYADVLDVVVRSRLMPDLNTSPYTPSDLHAGVVSLEYQGDPSQSLREYVNDAVTLPTDQIIDDDTAISNILTHQSAPTWFDKLALGTAEIEFTCDTVSGKDVRINIYEISLRVLLSGSGS